LQALSPDLRASLYHAVELADDRDLLTIVDRFPAEYQSLVVPLTELTEEFNFHLLFHLLLDGLQEDEAASGDAG